MPRAARTWGWSRCVAYHFWPDLKNFLRLASEMSPPSTSTRWHSTSHASFAQRVASETCVLMVLLLRPVGKSGGRGGDVGDCSMRTNADALFEIGGAEMSTRAAAIAVKSVTTMAGALAAERTGDW